MEKAIGPIAGIKALKYIPPFKEVYHNIKGNGNTNPDVELKLERFFLFQAIWEHSSRSLRIS